MADAQSIVGKKVRWVAEYDPQLSGKTFTIDHAVCEPDENNDVEGLPWFRIKDENGVERTAFPEELRTVDGSQGVPEGAEPTWRIGGKPIMDIHPEVEAISVKFFETHKEYFQ